MTKQIEKAPIVKFPDGQLGILLFRCMNFDCLYLLGDGRIIRLGGPEAFMDYLPVLNYDPNELAYD